MGANATADPNANAATVALLEDLWTAANTGIHYAGAELSWWDIWNSSSALSPEFEQFFLTTGKYPCIISLNDFYVHEGPGSYQYGLGNDIWGNSLPDWSLVLPALSWIAGQGGYVQLGVVSASNPASYGTGTTYSGSATTIGAINSAGTLPVTSIGESGGGSFTDPFLAPNWGKGVLVVGTGSSAQLTTFTYTGPSSGSGAGTLTGVNIALQPGMSSSTPVEAGSFCNVALLASYGTTLPDTTQGLPIQYSSVAYTEHGVGNSGSYSLAQQVNANANLNLQLDQIANLANDLNALGIPMVIRMFCEPNAGGSWWDVSWYPQLWTYCFVYLTGNTALGYPGQPVTANPIHNALFDYALSDNNDSTPPSFADPPPPYLVDLVSVDFYGSTPSRIPAALASMQAVTGYSNIPGGSTELYGNIPSNNACNAVLTGTSVDLSTLTSGSTLTGTMENVDSTDATWPSGSGHSIAVPTSKGIQTVTCSSISPTGTYTPGTTVTFTISSVSGVPSGSMTVIGSMVTQVQGGTATAASILAAQKTASTNANVPYPAYFSFWDGSFGLSQLYQGGMSALMNDPSVVTLNTSIPVTSESASTTSVSIAGSGTVSPTSRSTSGSSTTVAGTGALSISSVASTIASAVVHGNGTLSVLSTATSSSTVVDKGSGAVAPTSTSAASTSVAQITAPFVITSSPATSTGVSVVGSGSVSMASAVVTMTTVGTGLLVVSASFSNTTVSEVMGIPVQFVAQKRTFDFVSSGRTW